MATSFEVLRSKMSPASQAAAKAIAEREIKKMERRKHRQSRQESIRLTSNALKEETPALSRKAANHFARVLVDKAQADRK
jgi:TRAP-type C4-dicarboxylate transport system permease large subunit